MPDVNLNISEAELKRFGASDSLSSRVIALLNQQKQSWDLCGKNYEALKGIKTKSFIINGIAVRIQFNPGRIKSTSAKVDKKSINNRKCFLCLENLPPEQRGIPFGKDFLILCNPFPIFPEHFTIVKSNHVPQQINGNFDVFLSLIKELGDKLTVFYNGPKCGASAPDHMHFQAGTKDVMPLENQYDLLTKNYGNVLMENGKNKLIAVDDNLRKIYFIEGNNPEDLEMLFYKLVSAIQDLTGDKEEPMLNIVGSYKNNEWKLAVFPRAKHRPEYFYLEGNDKIMVSPAAVDMSGLIIVPREEDFEKLDEAKIRKIYGQVCINKKKFEKLSLLLRRAR